MSTTTLIQDLEQIQCDFPETRELMIFNRLKEHAKDGAFHDFESIFATPKMMLRYRLDAVASAVSSQECKKAIMKLVSRTREGIYDD